ncbi:uncharacterized protein MKZ38_009964 [Zalerion maritima]|uniref:Major facilitator superfamily (MFS) profile domain-containing protein n=1 Tax=Zalerion maritima TaxID=339359 RepID=A0AAD5WSQ8_9PEZI|nr:uncharacterized protein MKZ38_009964 [Zalerion maritima]
MDNVDRGVLRAEEDAVSPPMSPASTAWPATAHRNPDEIERVESYSTRSSSDHSIVADRSDILERRTSGLSRVTTHHSSVATGIQRSRSAAGYELSHTALSRIATIRSQQTATVGRTVRRRGSSSASRASKPLLAFGAGKPYPPPLPEQEDYVVEFDGPDDPRHAQNWPLQKKVLTAAMLGYTTMCSAFTSSIFSSAIPFVGAEFKVSNEVGTLGMSLFVLGFAFGPSLWAPLSELKGRRLPIIIAMFGFSIFSLATATAKDLQTVLITRFFGGFFGACPLAVVGAVMGDLFDNSTRGLAITLFSMAVFTGPLLGPFVGGFIVMNDNMGWRWTQYLPCIMGFVAFSLDFFFLEETYPPAILVEKAAELRRQTANWGIHAKQEEIEVDFKELVTKNFSRPMRLLFGEPIVLLLSIYMSFIYGLLYLFMTAYPFIFQKVYGFSPGVAGLAFMGMVAGQIIAGGAVIAQQPSYVKKLAANNGVSIPEWRLPSVIAGGISFSIGIFWLGWTGYSGKIHWIVPVLSGLCTGFGLMSIFLQSLNYLVDAYLMFAASAIAGNTFMRSLCGAAFPLFSTYMFDGMGIQWAATLLGVVAALLAPIPVFFYMYGAKIRQKSKFAPTISPEFEKALSSEDSSPIREEKQIDIAGLGSVPRRNEGVLGEHV